MPESTVAAVAAGTGGPKKLPAKKAASVKKPSAPMTHPKYSQMINQAIAALQERNGSSRQRIANYIRAHFQVNDRVHNKKLSMALKRGADDGTLKRVKGVGASGSFKVAVDAAKLAQQKAKMAEKLKAKMEKLKAQNDAKKAKAAAKKAASKANKSGAKKSVKKAVSKPKAASKPKASKPVTVAKKTAVAEKTSKAVKKVIKPKTPKKPVVKKAAAPKKATAAKK